MNPSKLFIGNGMFAVELKSEILQDHSPKTAGCFYDEKQIFIAKYLSEENRDKALVFGILSAIL